MASTNTEVTFRILHKMRGKTAKLELQPRIKAIEQSQIMTRKTAFMHRN